MGFRWCGVVVWRGHRRAPRLAPAWWCPWRLAALGADPVRDGPLRDGRRGTRPGGVGSASQAGVPRRRWPSTAAAKSDRRRLRVAGQRLAPGERVLDETERPCGRPGVDPAPPPRRQPLDGGRGQVAVVGLDRERGGGGVDEQGQVVVGARRQAVDRRRHGRHVRPAAVLDQRQRGVGAQRAAVAVGRRGIAATVVSRSSSRPPRS